MQGCKQTVFDCRNQVGRQTHDHNGRNCIPDTAGKYIPKRWENPKQHHFIEQQICDAVQPCTKVTGSFCFSGNPAIQYICQPYQGIQKEEACRQRLKKQQ